MATWKQPTGAQARLLAALQERREAHPRDPYIIGTRKPGDPIDDLRLSDVGEDRWQARLGELARDCGWLTTTEEDDGYEAHRDMQGRKRRRYRLVGHLSEPPVKAWWQVQMSMGKTKHNLAVTAREATALLYALRQFKEHSHAQVWQSLELEGVEQKLERAYRATHAAGVSSAA